MTRARFASVWDAIEDTPGEATNMKLRSRLVRDLQAHIAEKGWTQKEAANVLGVTQPRMSDLLRGKIQLFSLDMLVSLSEAAGLEVELHTKLADAA